jgi:hypothetical protein
MCVVCAAGACVPTQHGWHACLHRGVEQLGGPRLTACECTGLVGLFLGKAVLGQLEWGCAGADSSRGSGCAGQGLQGQLAEVELCCSCCRATLGRAVREQNAAAK